jgi:hypothetical protein
MRRHYRQNTNWDKHRASRSKLSCSCLHIERDARQAPSTYKFRMQLLATTQNCTESKMCTASPRDDSSRVSYVLFKKFKDVVIQTNELHTAKSLLRIRQLLWWWTNYSRFTVFTLFLPARAHVHTHTHACIHRYDLTWGVTAMTETWHMTYGVHTSALQFQFKPVNCVCRKHSEVLNVKAGEMHSCHGYHYPIKD